MISQPTYQLRVSQVGQICQFELTWGQGRSHFVEVDYPEILTSLFKDWQEAYLAYYSQLRGKKKHSGSVPKHQIDWRSHLVEAEAILLDQFHSWLRGSELYDIWREIETAARNLSTSGYDWVEVFLNCTPDLARLPWETWDIGDQGTAPKIRLARRPSNIRQTAVHPLNRKARVLVIMGDDTGIDLQGDLKATKSLDRTTQVEVVGWKPGKDAGQLKHEICDAIADPQGWDVLLFAGHSNETALTGGKLGIAPGVAMHISELQAPLEKAQSQGLQFALFNSCDGIDIAQSLIEMGLGQVVVMREPIHNRVAQDFLKQFLVSLAAYQDVHESLRAACEGLEQQAHKLDYPSAYLVPSLYRHPEAAVFRIQRFGIRQQLKRWKPTKPELRWVAALLLVSLIPPVQDLLMEPRILMQAVFRQLTLQVPAQEKPPVMLVSIDEKSLESDGVQLVYDRYLDYGYLARLVDELSKHQAKVIGIDYVLDKDQPQPEQAGELKAAVERAIAAQSWFVFAAQAENTVSPKIANRDRSFEGDVDAYHWYLELFDRKKDCLLERCPFAYLLSWSQALREGEGAVSQGEQKTQRGVGPESLHSPPCPPILGGSEADNPSSPGSTHTQSPPILGAYSPEGHSRKGGECKRSNRFQTVSNTRSSDFRALDTGGKLPETLHSPPCPSILGGSEAESVSSPGSTHTQSPPILGDLGGECNRTNRFQTVSTTPISNFRASVLNAKPGENSQLKFLQTLRLHPWTSVALHFGQRWGLPILDFSIPESRVSQKLSACEVLGSCEGKGAVPEQLQDQVVLIVHGGYEQGGLLEPGDDTYRLPLALAFWQGKEGWDEWIDGKETFTGGESHAYMIHHLLRERLVIPVPDFFMILVMAIVGKGVQIFILAHPRQRKTVIRSIFVGISAYFVASLQIYISGGVLLPMGLPVLMLGRYMRSARS